MVIANELQSWIDISVRQLGSLDNLFALASINNMSITDDLILGQSVLLTEVSDKNIVTYLENEEINPATGITTLTEEQARVFDETFDKTFN